MNNMLIDVEYNMEYQSHHEKSKEKIVEQKK